MSTTIYQQCLLSQGNRTIVSWIPVEGACIGNSMILIDPITKTQLDGRWVVEAVYTGTKTAEEAASSAHAHSSWRAKVDI